MSTAVRPNRQSGVPTVVSADDAAAVASADQRDGHYEEAEDQILKVVHQVRPALLPNQGPTDFTVHSGAQDPTLADVKVTPTTASVWEALPE